MSSEQTQLGNYNSTSTPEDDQTAPDQRETLSIPDWREVVGDATTNSHCQRCGAHVTPSYRRTHGNADGQVFGCMSCYDAAQISRGAAEQGENGDELGGLK